MITDLEKFVESGVVIEPNVEIVCEKLSIGSGTVIKSGSIIKAEEAIIGCDTVIEKNVEISDMYGKSMRLLKIGDDCYLGRDISVSTPQFELGDYVRIHKHVTVYGFKPCTIGHNSWIGQDSILNCNEVLKIGNNVMIGTNSYIWTHVAMGELLEGCNLCAEKPVTIEDDAWLVGGDLTINPGVTIANRSVILTNSVVSKDTIAGHCYAGIPAQDITHKVNPYKKVTLDEKFEMMKKFVKEFINDKTKEGLSFKKINDVYIIPRYCRIHFIEQLTNFKREDELDVIILTKSSSALVKDSKVSVFDLSSKRYTKRRTQAERDFIKFTRSFRARFIPL